MDAIFEIIGKVVATVGGAGVIIIGCSSWISKLWAKWFMEKEKQKYSKEIEKYKNELQKELETTRNLNEEIAYKKRFIFDSEYRYYEELVPQLIKAEGEIKQYLALKENYQNGTYDDKEICAKLIKEKYGLAYKESFKFNELLSKYAVFIDNESYQKMFNFFYSCFEILEKKTGDDENWDEHLKKIIEEKDLVITFLRNKIRK